MGEVYMDKYVNWVNEIKIQNTIKSLEDNNMKGYFANDKNELIKINGQVP